MHALTHHVVSWSHLPRFMHAINGRLDAFHGIQPQRHFIGGCVPSPVNPAVLTPHGMALNRSRSMVTPYHGAGAVDLVNVA